MDNIIELAHTLSPYTLCGEGNVSGRSSSVYTDIKGEESFWIKASGTSLDTLKKEDLVPCRMNGVPYDGLGLKPSMEVSFHAWILNNHPEVNYVAHTHPTYTNQILCSKSAYSFAENRLFPDQVVRNGRKSCIVPYATPGKELRDEIKKQIEYFIEDEGFFPKLILLENHGIITTGETHTECIASTLMCEKSAQIFVGARSLGQVQFLTEEQVAAVDKCPNEAYRRKLFQ
jgi:L-fuculose-phosphate aldolase